MIPTSGSSSEAPTLTLPAFNAFESVNESLTNPLLNHDTRTLYLHFSLSIAWTSFCHT